MLPSNVHPLTQMIPMTCICIFLRYPDDPYDRIWESDLVKRQNYLVGVASGTERIYTDKDVNIKTREYPPVKVMQTAVVGTKGEISYRLNLEDFPANARAYAYFAEIEDLGANETRKFKLQQPYIPDYSNAVVNIAENANGSYTLYEPSYMNVTLDFVLSFSFVKTRDSARGPLVNAMEISKYLKIDSKTGGQDCKFNNFGCSKSFYTSIIWSYHRELAIIMNRLYQNELITFCLFNL